MPYTEETLINGQVLRFKIYIKAIDLWHKKVIHSLLQS